MQERKPGCICELDEKTGEPLVADYAECPVHKPDAPDPKKTAEELVNKYSPIVYCYMGSGMLTNTTDQDVVLMNAKTAAKIAVDLVISIFDLSQLDGHGKYLCKFYKQVKAEIEKL